MAEVKVKITAQNEVRTGLQQALQETQKFSQEAKRAVSQTMTINPFSGDDRLGPLRELRDQARALRDQARAPIDTATIAPSAQGDQFASTSARGASAIRGLAADLANATSAADVFQAVISRISTAFGGLIAASAGFAIGSLIRRSLEDAAAGLNDLIDRGEQLSQTLSTLSAPTTNFEQFSSTLNSVRSQIEGLQKATEDYKSSFSNIAADFSTQQAGIAETLGQRFFAGTGQVAGRIADRILGGQGQLFNQADATEQQKLDEARLSIRAGIARQIANEIALSQQTTEEGRKQLAIEQERLKQRESLQKLLQAVQATPQETAQRLEEFDRLPSLQGQRAAQDRARELEAETAKVRAANEDAARSTEERVRREAQALANLTRFGGDVEPVKLAIEATGLDSVDALKAAIDSADSKTVEVALSASGLNSVDALKAAIAEVDLAREQSKAKASSLNRQLESEQERLANAAERGATVALETTGLTTIRELEAALDSVARPVNISALLEVTGAEDLTALRQAIIAQDGKIIALALEATGLQNADALRAALDEVQPKQVDVILRALGAESIDAAKAQLDSLDASARALIERTAQAEREKSQKKDTDRLAALERSIQSPEERRVALEAEQAALAQRAESLAPEDFVGRADVISEAQRIAGELRGLDQGQQGSLGASSLQRIGFASNEFFDTRRKEDPAKETKRAADFVKQIIDILKKGEPLVLPASS